MAYTLLDIAETKPLNPLFAFRPHLVRQAVRYFKKYSAAKILYAVKTNSERHVLETLIEEGVTAFDVASIAEVQLVHALLPEATLYFMHPVKSRYAIKEAYFQYGVRHFSLDTHDELQKILEETNFANDLSLHVRLAIPNNYSEVNLSTKFGADLQDASKLLRDVRKVAQQLGVCFHVGSQCMHPDAYRIAIRMASKVLDRAKVVLDYFNVGGGFPSIYPGMMPPALCEYFNVIHEEIAAIEQRYPDMVLLSEPGRALVAESTSLVVRVDLRKDHVLYINDGTYGSLFDAGLLHFIFPVRLLRAETFDETDFIPFSFYGPTCDSLDHMIGPFYLPSTVKEGDYIEIGQLGAYGRALATKFNGFTQEAQVMVVNDPPLLSAYADLEEGAALTKQVNVRFHEVARTRRGAANPL